uniref:Uncharacterized protein n=1 Tax=Ditylenchus dipsaci TaxID=166011 RepID=A0A915E469_9BILA
MEQKHGIEAGLVTRLDEQFIYVWWKKQHLDELIFSRCCNPEITLGDVVTFEINHLSTEVQEERISPRVGFARMSFCHRRDLPTLPNRRSIASEKGNVCMDHKPDTVYSCLIGRMPTKYDAKLKTKLDTLFFVTTHGIKENNDSEEIVKLREFAPWNQKNVVTERSPADVWVKDQVQPEEQKPEELDLSIHSLEISDSKPIVEFSTEGVNAVPKEKMTNTQLRFVRSSSPSIASMVSANFKPKVIHWVEDEDDLDTLSVDCLTKCLGLKLPERAEPVCDGERDKESQIVLGKSVSFSDISKLTQNTMKVEEEGTHGRNFDSVWDIYKKLRGKGLFLEAATLKKRSLDLCMEYEILLAKYNV